MYRVFLCPKCRGQGTTSCKLCSGLGKRAMAELVIGQCKACRGTGQQRCDVCGGTGEIDARDPFSRLRSRLASSG
jgi:hypothetical protein